MGFFDKLKGRQVRDQIKNEAYFRKYIQQQEKRIDRFSDMIKQEQVPKERICLVEAFIFQLYCDGEKLNIPNTLCIQGYQLFEKGDYNSDIVVIQLPLDAKENIQQVGLSCPVSPDYAGGDIEFEVVEEQDNYDLDDLNVDDFYRWTKMGVPCSKLLGWCEKEIIPSNCAFLGWLADEDPFVIGNGYNLCFFLTPEGKVIASYRAPC